jgi:hypothetical protein
MKKRSFQNGKPPLDLVEEAAHELRHTPARLWLAYYTGTVPFALGLLYFWSDMSYGALADRHCGGLALGVTVLFVWMKCWQTVFVAGVSERLAGRVPLPWSARRVGRVLLAQAVIQPSKLVVLPLATLTLLMFPWTLSFYESITVAGNGEQPLAVRELVRRAIRMAGVWPGQNVLLAMMLVLLAVMLWLNAVVAIFALPWLLKVLLGVETIFTQSGSLAIFNTTFLGATLALAALAWDPLVKMTYALRGFYCEARQDGADLKAELAAVRRGAGVIVMVAVILWLAVGHPAVASAAPAATPPATPAAPVAVPAASTTPAELEQALKSTLAEDKYTWRLPREKTPETTAGKGWFRAFFDSLGDTLAQWARAVIHWVPAVHRWFDKLFKHDEPTPDQPLQKGSSWMGGLRDMAYVLLFLAVAALGFLLWRYGRLAWAGREMVKAEVLPAQPDLTDENLTASQLPEDEWLRLARDLAAKGEWRLALRALYLATLAHLAARDLVSIARFKSNRDYQLELARRARSKPELRQAFDANVAVFDGVWYGPYPVSGEGFREFQTNLERIRAC